MERISHQYIYTWVGGNVGSSLMYCNFHLITPFNDIVRVEWTKQTRRNWLKWWLNCYNSTTFPRLFILSCPVLVGRIEEFLECPTDLEARSTVAVTASNLLPPPSICLICILPEICSGNDGRKACRWATSNDAPIPSVIRQHVWGQHFAALKILWTFGELIKGDN